VSVFSTPVSGGAPDPPVHAPPALETLRDAFTGAARAGNFAAAGLRDAVCEYTRECRAAGLPPERVLVAVKAAAAAVGLVHRGQGEPNQELERVVRWCISEYYRAG